MHIYRHGQAGRRFPQLRTRVKKDVITFNEYDSRNPKEEEYILIETKVKTFLQQCVSFVIIS
jgi:hypothetical protein